MKLFGNSSTPVVPSSLDVLNDANTTTTIGTTAIREAMINDRYTKAVTIFPL
jgi:hypothetical protein